MVSGDGRLTQCSLHREEVQYCDNNCQKYVSLWEANNHSKSAGY